MSTDPDIVHNLFAYLEITQEFHDSISAAADTPSQETDTSSTGDKQEEEHLRLVSKCSLEVLNEFKTTYLGKITSDTNLKPLLQPHKIKSILNAIILEYRQGTVHFQSTLFAVIIPLSKAGDIAATVRGPEGEEVELNWRTNTMIVLSRKCDLLISGPGKLVGLLIVFKE